MFILQKRVQEIIDTSLIYSRVIAMQLTNVSVTLENIFKHELALISISIFNDNNDLRLAKSKADLKRSLARIHGINSHNEQTRTYNYWTISNIMGGKLVQEGISNWLFPLTAHIYHVMTIMTGGFSKKSFLLLFPRNSSEQSWTCYLGI